MKAQAVINFQYNDGGRAEATYRGRARDCVARAIAIASDKPYQEVYDAINEVAKSERRGMNKRKISSSRGGVFRHTYEAYLLSLGFVWFPTMTVGSGCTVHLRADELPEGRLVVSLSRHLSAVIDRVVHDVYDPSRDGTRCVYGYYKLAEKEVNQ